MLTAAIFITLNVEFSDIKNLLCTMSFSKIIYLQKSYLLIRCYNTRFILWNTNNTNRNGVNKQNTHTHTHTHTHTTLREGLHWKGLVSMKISYTPLFENNPPPLFYQPLPFYGKKSGPPLFSRISNPP